MESKARHPYGKAIVRYLENTAGVELIVGADPRESIGSGVVMEHSGRAYRIGRCSDERGGVHSPTIEFECEGELLAQVEVDDELRSDAPSVIQEMETRGIQVEILSGDSVSAVRRIADRLGVVRWSAGVSPEGKAEYLEKGPKRAIVIGDGVNDSLALRRAFVGLAFNRGDGTAIETSLRNVDAAILSPNLRSVVDLLEVARRYRRTLFRGAAFSVFYNLVGACFAVAGFVHPLVAAIAMPVSALTLFLSTVIGLTDFKREVR
jgi:P-type E1-E2 ATPase